MILGEVQDCLVVVQRRLLERTNRVMFRIGSDAGVLGG